MTRREWSDLLVGRLNEEIARGIPPSLGAYDEAWAHVSPASADLLLALAAWECDGSPDSKRAAVAAAKLVVLAWREASLLIGADGPGQSSVSP